MPLKRGLPANVHAIAIREERPDGDRREQPCQLESTTGTTHGVRLPAVTGQVQIELRTVLDREAVLRELKGMGQKLLPPPRRCRPPVVRGAPRRVGQESELPRLNRSEEAFGVQDGWIAIHEDVLDSRVLRKTVGEDLAVQAGQRAVGQVQRSQPAVRLQCTCEVL
eukprot:scaffold2329_cov247-Pinguiococcus_pyrenoidosus.AAC.3